MTPEALKEIECAYVKRLVYEWRYIRCRATKDPRRPLRYEQYLKAYANYVALRRDYHALWPSAKDERDIIAVESKYETRRIRNNLAWQEAIR